MTRLRVDQAIYTRLEGKYSPTGQSGYQLAFKPTRLRPRVRSTLEDLLPGFRPRAREDARIQFAAVDVDKFMISYTTVPPIDSASAGIADRGGLASLAHAILIHRDDFATIDFNPFRIVDAMDWITDFQDLIECFGDLNGVAPSLPIEPVEKPSRPTHTETEANDIRRLVRDAPGLIERRETVDLEGSPSDAAEWLRVAFHYATPEQAERCSFTTSFDPHDQPRGRFWAVARVPAGQGTTIRYHIAEKRLVVVQ